jgi:hypothetical protein
MHFNYRLKPTSEVWGTARPACVERSLTLFLPFEHARCLFPIRAYHLT